MKAMKLEEAKTYYEVVITKEAERVSDQIFTLIDGILCGIEMDDVMNEIFNQWCEERRTWVDGIKECKD